MNVMSNALLQHDMIGFVANRKMEISCMAAIHQIRRSYNRVTNLPDVLKANFFPIHDVIFPQRIIMSHFDRCFIPTPYDELVHLYRYPLETWKQFTGVSTSKQKYSHQIHLYDRPIFVISLKINTTCANEFADPFMQFCMKYDCSKKLKQSRSLTC